MDKKNTIIKIGSFIAVVITIVVSVIIGSRQMEKGKEAQKIKNEYQISGDFDVDIIKQVHAVSNNKNYLLSPYNIMIALNMLRDGSEGKTKEELDEVLGNRIINDLKVENKIGIANGVFIKNQYQKEVLDSYYNLVKDKYQADILFDEYTTPQVINDWVNKNTWGMIERIIDTIDKSFVLGLASALAIDVKWQDEFECHLTMAEEFTKIDNSKMQVEMMHKVFKNADYKYINNSDVEGVVIPYERLDNVELEFIGLKPKTSIDDFIKNLSKEKLTNLVKNTQNASSKFHINVSLPRFKYSYEVDDFKKVLISLGIKEVFNPATASLTKIIPNNSLVGNLYVSDAIHKTYIDLSETGTKAAAVTYFGIKENSAFIEDDYEEVKVNFNKPFVYLIRAKNTGDILFFGTVYEPNKWVKTTCKEN